MRKLLIATTNQGKIREIKDIFQDFFPDVLTLNDLDAVIKVEETGKTFAENACLKAQTVGRKTGYLTLAEDSGLVVDALNGRPGIQSARYCAGSDEDRNKKLLSELKGVPVERRTARYKASVAVFDPQEGSTRIFEGSSEGYITEKPIGSNGFGYDPVFFNLTLGKTNGEASLKEKNKVSHRAKALTACRRYLKSLG